MVSPCHERLWIHAHENHIILKCKRFEQIRLKFYDKLSKTLNLIFFNNVENKIIFLLNNKCGHRNVLSKRKVWMSIFQGSWIFFIKKLILDFYFCLMSGPVFLFQIFIIAPLPSQGIYNCIINNKLINNKFRFSI